MDTGIVISRRHFAVEAVTLPVSAKKERTPRTTSIPFNEKKFRLYVLCFYANNHREKEEEKEEEEKEEDNCLLLLLLLLLSVAQPFDF